MLKSYIDYGCVVTKVRAMYGKRLTVAEWSRLAESSSLAEIAGVLRESKGWRQAADLVPPGSIDLKVLTDAVRRQVRSEYESLLKFVLAGDREYLSFYLREDEYRLILAAVRRLTAKAPPDPAEPPELLRRKSRIDFSALAGARSFQELVTAADGSIYRRVLSSLQSASGSDLPDYASVAVALENTYYSELYRYASRKYKGSGRSKLRELVGAEADMLNILGILRILRHFPDSVKDIYDVIIPVRRRLSDGLLASLAAAPSEAAAVGVLRDSYWRGVFEDYRPENLGRLFDKYIEALNKKILRSADPGLASVAAYLRLKSAEGDRLIRTVTSVYYGLSPAREPQ